MSTKEVAKRFHELAQEGKWNQIQDELFSKDSKSIEPAGSQPRMQMDEIALYEVKDGKIVMEQFFA